uniref:BMA-TBC-20; TBC1 domain family protein C20orf140 homolog, putative n=1 Tax=Brugia malayi TaxID=6279 RepID=A0A7I4KLU5_BRUMA
MPSLPDYSASFVVAKKFQRSKVNENVLRNAVSRTLQIKCNRMRTFIDENHDSLHLHISQLRQFAASTGGLVLDEIRALVWPVLASSLVQDSFTDQETASTFSDSDFESAHSDFTYEEHDSTIDSATILSSPTLKDLQSHREWNQVQMDVQRTLARFPPDISDKERCTLQEDLTPLIVKILWSCPRFHYYQGFHDVCLTLLLVLGNEKAEHVGILLANNGIFKGYLLRKLEDTVLRDLDLMHVLLWKVDEELEKVVRAVELGSLFALSWPLTWFSHALHHYHQIVLCFDFFLATHALTPIFLTSAVVLWRSNAVLNCSRDMASIHHLLNVIPNDIPVQALINDAQDLFRMFPPSRLRGPLMEDYQHLINISRIRKPSFPKTSLRKWLVAGTATAAIYVLSRYMFITSSY